MSEIKFLPFSQVNAEEFLSIVNEKALRKHLIDHDVFTSSSLRQWMSDKLEIDAQEGCRIRAVYVGENLAGWCGIQPDEKGFEIAIVLSREYWGQGISIFKTLMLWAKDLGHREILFHLLDSRPEYKALRKIACRVERTELLGRRFTTYCIDPGDWLE